MSVRKLVWRMFYMAVKLDPSS